MAAVQRLKALDTNRMDMDELIELSSDAQRLAAERERHQLGQPEWLTDCLQTLNREIALRSRDELEKRLKELRAQESGLETVQEKRERIKRDREAIEAKLGTSTPAVPA